MKKLNRIIVLFLAAVFVFSFTACNTANTKDDGYIVNNTEEYPRGVHKAQVKKTSASFFQDGKSDYKIVIPYSSTETENIAAQELSEFLQLSTGYSFAIISDSDLSFQEGDKYISVGETALFYTSGIIVNFNELKSSGFKILTKNNTIFLIGRSDGYGVIYAAHELLKYFIDFEVFATTDVRYEKRERIEFFEFDVTEIPAIETCITSNSVWSDPKQLYRMRMLDRKPQFGFPFSMGHTITEIVPYSVYGAEHKDWYADNPAMATNPEYTQVCFSNRELADKLVELIVPELLSDPMANKVFLGQSDGTEKCNCERCETERKLYGPQESALLIRFVNYVSENIDRRMREAGDARKITYGTFIYANTEEAPVRQAEDGTIEANHPSVIPRENVAVMWNPLGALFDVPFSDPENKFYYDNIKKWSAIAPNIWYWGYGVNYNWYFMGLDIYGALKDNYIMLAEMNSSLAMIQFSYKSGLAHFTNFKEYLYTNLTWNPYQDMETLIDTFMQGYYREAGDAMREYYDLLRVHYAYLRNDPDHPLKGYFNATHTRAMWPDNFLTNMEGILDKAFESIEKYRNTDPVLYEELYDKINVETLSPRFIKLYFHRSLYSTEQLTQMIDSFETDTIKYGILHWNEHSKGSQHGAGEISEIVAEWRNSL